MLEKKAASAAMIAASLPLALLSITPARCAPQSDLIIRVANVRNAKGVVHAEVCPQALFLGEDCRYVASAPAHAGVVVLTVRGVPPGHYAVQAFHDENGNHRLDRAAFGIPREGFAFSNDAPIRFGPPKWTAAAFTFNGGEQTIQVTTRYIMGASGFASR